MAKYGVYIIEFLRKKDKYFDGEALHHIITLAKIPTKYKWINNVEEFKAALKDFKETNYRYLHISCHANEFGIELNGELILNHEVEEFTKKYLTNKRLFLSACKGANRDLASKIIMGNNAWSLLGMPIQLRFIKSALFWPSFYHLINEIDSKKMLRNDIVEIVKKCVDIFDIPVNYYCRIEESKTHIRRLKIRQGINTDNRRIKSTMTKISN